MRSYSDVFMGNKKLRKSIEKSKKEIITALNAALSKNGELAVLEMKKIVRKPYPDSEKNKRAKHSDYNMIVSKMLGELYEVSGTSSGSETYPFTIGENGAKLRKVQDKIINHDFINKEDVDSVYRIYKEFLPEKAAGMKLKLAR